MVVELLDGNGADPCATDANGWTGLHCCGYYSTAEHGKIAKELLDRDVNVRLSFFEILLWFHDGETPRPTDVFFVGRCVFCSSVEQVDARTLRQRTPLHLAVLQEHRFAGDSHVDSHHVDENTRTHCRMPEHKVARTRLSSLAVVGLVELLARRGCDLDAVDLNGLTALHFAVRILRRNILGCYSRLLFSVTILGYYSRLPF